MAMSSLLRGASGVLAASSRRPVFRQVRRHISTKTPEPAFKMPSPAQIEESLDDMPSSFGSMFFSVSATLAWIFKEDECEISEDTVTTKEELEELDCQIQKLLQEKEELDREFMAEAKRIEDAQIYGWSLEDAQ